MALVYDESILWEKRRRNGMGFLSFLFFCLTSQHVQLCTLPCLWQCEHFDELRADTTECQRHTKAEINGKTEEYLSWNTWNNLIQKEQNKTVTHRWYFGPHHTQAPVLHFSSFEVLFRSPALLQKIHTSHSFALILNILQEELHFSCI